MRKHINMTDIWIFLIVILFTVAIDVIYVSAHYRMGIQLSDWWLMCNVIFYGIELICITAYNITKKLNPEQKEVYTETAAELGKGVGCGIISAITNNGFQMPDITSGNYSTSNNEIENSEEIEEGDNSDEAMG